MAGAEGPWDHVDWIASGGPKGIVCVFNSITQQGIYYFSSVSFSHYREILLLMVLIYLPKP